MRDESGALLGVHADAPRTSHRKLCSESHRKADDEQNNAREMHGRVIEGREGLDHVEQRHDRCRRPDNEGDCEEHAGHPLGRSDRTAHSPEAAVPRAAS